MKRPGFEADRFGLMEMDLASGRSREIAPKWDRSADGIALTNDGRTIYTTATDLGEHPLFAIDIATGEAKKLVGEGSVSAIDLAGPTLALTRNTLKTGDVLHTTSADASAPLRAITPTTGERLRDVDVRRFRTVRLQGLERRHRARLHRQAVELPGRQEVPGRLPDPRRPAGQLRQRLELPLEPADVRGPGLRGGDDRLPRFHRLRPGVHRCDQPALGRPPAGRPAEGLGRGAAAVRLPRRRQGLRAGRQLRRLHGQLDRRQLVQP